MNVNIIKSKNRIRIYAEWCLWYGEFKDLGDDLEEFLGEKIGAKHIWGRGEYINKFENSGVYNYLRRIYKLDNTFIFIEKESFLEDSNWPKSFTYDSIFDGDSFPDFWLDYVNPDEQTLEIRIYSNDNIKNLIKDIISIMPSAYIKQ